MRVSLKYGPFSTDNKAARFYDRLTDMAEAGQLPWARSIRMSPDIRSIVIKTKSTSLEQVPMAEEAGVQISARLHIAEYFKKLSNGDRLSVIIFNHNREIAKPYVMRFGDEEDTDTAAFVFKSGCYETVLVVDSQGQSTSCRIFRHSLKGTSKGGYLIESHEVFNQDFNSPSGIECLEDSHYCQMARLAFEKAFVSNGVPTAHVHRQKEN